jgi:hypothetical protein
VSHYCGRRHLITRWDLFNISLSCVYCNKWLSGNLIEYRKALIEKCGIKEVERLESIYQQPAGYSVFDLQIMYEEYKKVYESLKRAKDLELV